MMAGMIALPILEASMEAVRPTLVQEAPHILSLTAASHGEQLNFAAAACMSAPDD